MKEKGRLEVRSITQEAVPITLLEAARTVSKLSNPSHGD